MTTYAAVLELADQLSAAEQRALIQHLEQQLRAVPAPATSFRAALEALVVDMGPVPADYAFSREDWYGDDGR